MTRSTDITSSSDIRQNLRKHLNRVKRTGRPLYVTTNGRTEAVVLSPAAYDELVERAEAAESLASIDRGVEDAAAGRVHDFRRAVAAMAAEFAPRRRTKRAR